MKLKFSINSINVSLTNAEGEIIYSHRADALDAELNIAKLIESFDDIQQAVFAAMEKAFTEPTAPTA